MGVGEYDAVVSRNYFSQGRLLARRRSKRPFSTASSESNPEAYPQGYVEDFDELRTKLADFFSALLRTTGGTCDGLLEHRTEAEVGNGIFEVGV
jgi:hypothetical protein